jgi:HEAT repeat protein|tara:strand:- start:694 stop:1164 length:471 start_codon:yes stop_codon:yes gene_type:complete
MDLLCTAAIILAIPMLVIIWMFYMMMSIGTDFSIEKTPEEEEKEKYEQMDKFDQLISELDEPRDFLGDPESGMDAVRRIDEVIEKLVEIGDVRAVEPLIMLAKKRDSFSSESAINALGNFDDKRSIDYLVKSLKDKDRDIRTAAVESLEELGWEPE